MLIHGMHGCLISKCSCRRVAQQTHSGKQRAGSEVLAALSSSVCQEWHHLALLHLSTLLGLAKAAPKSLSSQGSRNGPAESLAPITSDPHIFALCSQGSRYTVFALLCEYSSQSSWKNKKLNSGKIKTTNLFPSCL